VRTSRVIGKRVEITIQPSDLKRAVGIHPLTGLVSVGSDSDSYQRIAASLASE
jgi:hypothetical protein